jgi:FemAB-related protein (PEP-CTERM system-associated)
MNSPARAPQAHSWTLHANAQPSADWDRFVDAQPGASVYLLSGWSLLAREVFGHDTWFIEARDAAGVLCGVLPVVHQKSLLGNFATSVAFFNYGGALCREAAVAQDLMQHARSRAEAAGCSYLELRDVAQHGGDWSVRTDKVSMVLPLPDSFDKLTKQLGSKLRSQAKRADREQPAVRIGGRELADDFYGVFAHNMRDLGTPVYPRKFFHAMLKQFPEQCHVLVVDCRGRPAAAAFIVMHNRMAEIPWAACRAEAKPLGFNMKLYWEVLSFVTAQGCSSFDFGRSTVDAGTYRFKQQWGAKPVQLYWHRWERRRAPGGAQASGSSGRLMRYASAMWQRLPVGVANVLGPAVSPYLPW